MYVGQYYGSLMIADLSYNQFTTMGQAEHIMEGRRETLQRWTNRLHEKVVEKDNLVHKVWIIPISFCRMRHTNDVHYMPGDEAPEVGCVQRLRKTYVEFYQTRSPEVCMISILTIC